MFKRFWSNTKVGSTLNSGAVWGPSSFGYRSGALPTPPSAALRTCFGRGPFGGAQGRLRRASAGVAMTGVGQAASDPVSTLTTIIVLVACLLPILMAIFGAFVMRLLGWMTRQPSTEDEVVYPEATLPPGIHLPDPTIWPAVLAFGLMGLMFAIALDSWLEWVALGLGALLTVVGLLGWIVLEVREFRLGARRKT